MRKLILLFVAAISLSSCSSSDDSLLIVDLTVDSLSGTWKMTDAYVSPGGETTWQTVENGTEYTFSPNGNFNVTQEECPTGTYNLNLDENKLSFTCTNDTESMRSFRVVSITESEMEISYIGCIEACIYRYRKQ
ncbi:lipocalin family protein [Christiangramia sp. ASW11-125]|uniref:lipocalin family protein n=1 Tax=Christiangramia sp. ASW11-125 TaxID=3400701 RepID=UPI003AABBE12